MRAVSVVILFAGGFVGDLSAANLKATHLQARRFARTDFMLEI